MTMLNGNHSRRLDHIERNHAGNVKIVWRDCGDTRSNEELIKDWHKARPAEQALGADECIFLSWNY